MNMKHGKSGIHGNRTKVNKMKIIKLIVIFLLFTMNLGAVDFSGFYIVDYSSAFKSEVLILQKLEDEKYFYLLSVPTSNGRKSFSKSLMGVWDGEQILLKQFDTIHALQPLENGFLHFYLVEGDGEFPGKNYRPITEEDLKKIAEMK